MKILIGDLAKLYGISSQTLHYYEEKNIMHPERDVLSGYREFETSDLHRLGAIKKHRNANFSLSKAVKIYDEATELDIITEYRDQKRKIWREIEEKQFLIRQYDEHLSSYMLYKEIGQTIQIEKLSGFLRFESEGGQIIIQDKTLQREAIPWFSNIFYTNGSQMFYFDLDNKKIIKSTNGMIATLEASNFLHLKLTKHVKEIKAGKFVTSFIDTNIEEDYKKGIYKCMEYIKDKNLSLRGMPFTQTVLVFKDNEDNRKVMEKVMVPIE